VNFWYVITYYASLACKSSGTWIKEEKGTNGRRWSIGLSQHTRRLKRLKFLMNCFTSYRPLMRRFYEKIQVARELTVGPAHQWTIASKTVHQKFESFQPSSMLWQTNWSASSICALLLFNSSSGTFACQWCVISYNISKIHVSNRLKAILIFLAMALVACL
jgi:hypothetical protein